MADAIWILASYSCLTQPITRLAQWRTVWDPVADCVNPVVNAGGTVACYLRGLSWKAGLLAFLCVDLLRRWLCVIISF